MKFSKFNKFKTYTFKQKILALFAIALVLVALIMSVFGYRIGHKQGARHAIASMNEEAEEGVNSVQVASLKQQLDAVVQERDISLSNLETLREQNDSLKTKNLQLKQFNDLLLDTVTKEGGMPLKVLGAEVVPFPERTYEYRFDVAMIDKSGRGVMMSPKLTLINTTSEAKIPLKSGYEIKGVTHIRGRFVMPKGFEPRQMKLELYADGEKTEQLYDWKVGEPVAVTEDKGVSERPVGTN